MQLIFSSHFLNNLRNVLYTDVQTTSGSFQDLYIPATNDTVV